jgi:amino-acid N-acetyltransferase
MLRRFNLLLNKKGGCSSGGLFEFFLMNKALEYQFVFARGRLKQEVLSILEQNELPTSDIDETKTLFALSDGHSVIGTGGLEFFGDCALLRSLSVKKDWQGKGLGRFITGKLEQVCRERGIKNIYLLTTTAEDFFNKEGYLVMDRADAPLSIKNCSQFTTVCSSSGILMRKII